MRKVFQAFSAESKLHNVERIHSKLIHLTYVDGALNDKFDTNGYSIDLILNAFKEYIECCNEFGNNKYYKNYILAIEQAISITSKFRNKEKNFNKIILKRCYCFMAGRFMQFRNAFKKKFYKHCETQYQHICVPMYKLDKQYISSTN